MLEKLLGSRSFGTIISHLVYYQVTFPISSRGLGLSLVVRCFAPAFLGCWALIIFTLVFHFQQDDHFILLGAMAHVKISIYPF
jgi:hypothetical protein